MTPSRSRDGQLPNIAQGWVMGDYFDTMGITLKRGRLFTPEDRLGNPGVVVISETAARIYWPGQDPIGKRMKFMDDPWRTVIGMVGDMEDSSMSGSSGTAHAPYLQVADKDLENPLSLDDRGESWQR
jgi:MacB-like periplasmic core domain